MLKISKKKIAKKCLKIKKMLKISKKKIAKNVKLFL